MKLQTRIIGISFAAVFAAILVSDVAIWHICVKSFLREATQEAGVKAVQIFNEFGTFVEKCKGGADRTAVDYFFKSRRDDYTVCAKSGEGGDTEEYYNHTVFTLEELKEYLYTNFENHISYAKAGRGGHRLLCFRFYTEGGFELYHIADIGGVYHRLTAIALAMAVIFVFVALAAWIMLRMLLRGALRPLDELSKTAVRIAGGAYQERARAVSKDEVGTLAANFNIMASAVEERIRQLKEAEKRKDLFMGNLTHELKTPLTAISGYAQTMRRVKLSEKDRAEALDYICRECERLERLSGKMTRLLELDYSAKITLTEFPVNKLFKAAAEAAGALSKQRGVSVVVKDTRETLRADFDLMCDALINLTDNAVKASVQGAAVWLYTQSAKEGFYLVVEDFGRGIAPEEKAHILEPFYMADKSRSRKDGGSGLGLALTAAILKSQKMTLEMESEIGRGTKMKIYNSIKSR